MFAVLPFLAGCPAHSTRSGGSVRVSPEVKLACDDPVILPDRDLQPAEAARLWGMDRASLGTCRDRHKAAAAIITILESQDAE